jgi:hypothetical protein
MKIIIPTCDKYRNIIEANKYTMDKFGGSNLDVTVLGYKKPDFDMGSWKFISLGEDSGAKNFTNDIWKFFENFDDEFFIYGNDDIIAVGNLDLELLTDMENTMKNNPNVVKICLTSAAINHYINYNVFENKKDFVYKEVPQNADYRLSLHYSMWRTSYFKKHCSLGISPWEFELRSITKNDGAILLGTIGRYFLDFGHIFRKDIGLSNNWYKSEYTGNVLSNEDFKYIESVIQKIK